MWFRDELKKRRSTESGEQVCLVLGCSHACSTARRNGDDHLLGKTPNHRRRFEPLGVHRCVRLWGRRSFTRQPENSKRAHLRSPRFKHHQNSTRRPRRERKKTKMGAGDEKKKREILGSPPFGAHPSGRPGGCWRELAPDESRGERVEGSKGRVGASNLGWLRRGAERSPSFALLASFRSLCTDLDSLNFSKDSAHRIGCIR